MNARAEQRTTIGPAPALPIDADTIGETIRRALWVGAGRPDLDTLAGLEEMLRGHIALLLPDAREAARRRWSTDHQLITRLNGIERQMNQGLGSGALSAHVQVHQLARDCQYLLAMLTAEAWL
ncbi:DUF6415 family natural product biosynthesis protein [Streptomyces sp. NPDC048506]|uniref:DUF6415 family natural product biosynthesis protein n=1 Tax=Streptomyces sp. NPDC048506 TaxID=3155028 RepID=UPI003421A2C7